MLNIQLNGFFNFKKMKWHWKNLALKMKSNTNKLIKSTWNKILLFKIKKRNLFFKLFYNFAALNRCLHIFRKMFTLRTTIANAFSCFDTSRFINYAWSIEFEQALHNFVHLKMELCYMVHCTQRCMSQPHSYASFVI